MEANLRYRVLISWSDEDDSFIAEAPELPGCAAEGQTYQEAVANVEAVMREWIETARSLKRPIPVPGGK
jgi:predicted RNase H-like HicB family nuclease